MSNISITNSRLIFTLITIVSGFCGIFLETMSNKVFTYFFGISLVATTVTVTIYFSGLALGSFLFSRSAKDSKDPLLGYGYLELIIALYLLIYPFFYKGGFYLLNLEVFNSGFGNFAIRALTILFMLFIPSILVGATTPYVFRIVSRFFNSDQYFGWFYGANTFGALLGVLISSYFLFPNIGLEKSSWLASAINFLIFISVLTYRNHTELFSKFETFRYKYLLSNPKISHFMTKGVGSDILIIAFLSGFFIFSIEIVWFNLLSLIIGNSVYAFAIMLISVLVGISLGGTIVANTDFKDVKKSFVYTQVLVTLVVFVSMYLWDSLGSIFTFVGMFNPSFALMETTRFLVSFIFLLVPSTLVGISFPLLMEVVNKNTKDAATTAGTLYSINAIGSAIGLICSCFIFINYLGNHLSLTFIGSIPIVTAFFMMNKKNLSKGLTLAMLVLLFARFPLAPKWDILKMTGGQNIYFSRGNEKSDMILEHKESTYSGSITLIDKKGVKTLYTNGKFEGNDSTEIFDQYLFSLIPSMFVENFQRAANLGLGVGGSLGALAQFPFKDVDLIEISPDIIDISKRYFKKVNFNVLENPKLNIFLQDGRIHFMKNKDTYDLITMEPTSIWFAGSGNLYSKEFYKIIRDSLKTKGVFQQWIQLHHMTVNDIARIIKTFRTSFKKPTMWIMGHQAILVAKKDGEISAEYEHLIEIAKYENVVKVLDSVGFESIFKTFNHMVLNHENINKFITDTELLNGSSILVHEDLNPILEFSTPRSNTLKDAFSINREIIYKYKWIDFNKVIENIPLERSKDIVEDIFYDVIEE